MLTPDLVRGSAGGTLEWNWPWLVTESGLADMMIDVLVSWLIAKFGVGC